MNRQLLTHNLIQHNPLSIHKNSKFAAVAIILYMDDSFNELFLIKRTVHPNDPWSGQIGLPGGHHEKKDQDLTETAIRETNEETTIKLAREHLICQINDQQGYAQGGQINLTVRPFVFILNQKPAQVQMNYELERYYWLPLSHFQQPESHVFFDPMNSASKRPGIRVDQSNNLWGMTYRIMADFFNASKLETVLIYDDFK